MTAYTITVARTSIRLTGNGADRTETTDNPHRDALVAAEVLDSLGHEVKVIL